MKDKNSKKNYLANISKIKDSKFNPFILVLVMIVVWSISSIIFNSSTFNSKTREVTITEVFGLIKNNEVEKIIIDNQNVNVALKNGEKIKSRKEPEVSFLEMLSFEKIDPSLVAKGIENKQGLVWVDILSNIAFPLISLVFIYWIFRQAGKSAGGIFSLGKSRAKLFEKNNSDKAGFKDVAGAKEIKEEVYEVVDFLKNPLKYRKLGARIPRGVLLIGPSGVGKTLIARAIAGEANVPFYSVAGSEFIEMIVGVGSARVRDLFAVAKASSPSLIFIDEIDAIGRHRGRSMMSSNDEREQTLNQILVEMDGFDQRTNVIIIAATNRPDMLDSALIRPGRFDRHIKINLPDVKEREEIIKLHMIGKPFDKDVSVENLAKQTVGFSGADIENMINEGAILAARNDRNKITKKDIINASTKVKLGPERRLLQTEEERKVVAYHEAGHALVAAKNKNADPVSRISIISRAMSLGHTEFLPEGNAYNQTKKVLLAKIQSALGGRAAEELIFNEETVGAAGDIEHVTYIAKKMVTDFGMSSLGPINFVNDSFLMLDGNDQNKAVGFSQETASRIDKEVYLIVDREYKAAKELLNKHRKILDKIAAELLEKETLEQEEFEKIINEFEEKKKE